mgnify:CR=1 FL=1
MKKIIKKFLSCMLCCVIVAGLTPCVVNAAQFYSTPNKVMVSNNLRYKSSTKTWTFGGDGNNNNPIGVDDITWGDQANCAMVTTIAFRSATHKPVSAGDTLNVEANVSLYDYDNAGYTMYFCIFNADGKQLIEPRKMNKSGTNKYSIAAKINNDVDGYFGFISGKLTCNKASESSHVFTAKIANWTVQCEPGEVGFWNAVKEALTNVLNWLKEIRDKLVNGFNDMVNAIQLQFHQLVEKLQKLFDDVTEWLFNIADSIQEFIHKVGNWFTDLYNNIAGKIDLVITDIKQWVHDLFVPDPQYMDEYRTKWDQWMQLHLGFLYQSMAIIESLMSTINNGQANSTLIVIIPKLQLPENFGGHVIFEGGSFNLGNELLEKHSKIKWLYTTSQAFITGLAVFWTVYFGYKKIHVLIAERSD